MLLRSLSKHVKDQNWFAVLLDFIIVVVGVFIGIKVANWNQEQTFNIQELEMLGELKAELQSEITLSNKKMDSYIQATAAGKRILNFIAKKSPCGSNCWLIVVDFLHASQWQDVRVKRSTYDNMRRLGFPREKQVFEAVESYLAYNEATAKIVDDLPYYRALIRQLLPLNIQEYYWDNCYSFVDGAEIYDLDCPKGVSDEITINTVESVLQNPKVVPHLTQWMSNTVSLESAFIDQNNLSLKAIVTIDSELERK